MKTTMFRTKDEFITYLEGTLIPDLYESGRDATAEDFEEAVLWMTKDEKPAVDCPVCKLPKQMSYIGSSIKRCGNRRCNGFGA